MKKTILLLLILAQYQLSFSQSKEFSPKILLGISASHVRVSGDVWSNKNFGQQLSAGILGKFQFSKYFSTGLQISRGSTTGLNTIRSIGYQFATNGNNPWQLNGYTTPVYYNYKMTFTRTRLNAGVNTNSSKKISFGVQPSVGILNFKTKVNALNQSNQQYDFANFDLNDFDNTYESDAESESNTIIETIVALGPTIRFNKNLYVSVVLNVGFTNSDLLDGNQWQERNAKTRDKDNLLYGGINILYEFNPL